MTALPLGPSCPLQAILLGDLVGWSLQQAATPDPANSNVNKVRQMAITVCSGLLYTHRVHVGVE